MLEQDNARVGGSNNFDPASLNDRELKEKAERMQALRDEWKAGAV